MPRDRAGRKPPLSLDEGNRRGDDFGEPLGRGQAGKLGRLALQAGREREFANLYRGSDAARRLSDEDFAEVLKFTQAAFELALAFRTRKDGAPRAAPAGPRRAPRR